MTSSGSIPNGDLKDALQGYLTLLSDSIINLTVKFMDSEGNEREEIALTLDEKICQLPLENEEADPKKRKLHKIVSLQKLMRTMSANKLKKLSNGKFDGYSEDLEKKVTHQLIQALTFAKTLKKERQQKAINNDLEELMSSFDTNGL